MKSVDQPTASAPDSMDVEAPVVATEEESRIDDVPSKPPRAKATRKAAPTASEDVQPVLGISPFPISKISKIIKQDKDVQMCQKEAVFLISCATEHFIKRISDAAYTRARMDKRGKSVLYKDLAGVCSSENGMPSEFFYLEDLVPKQTQATLKAAPTAPAKPVSSA